MLKILLGIKTSLFSEGSWLPEPYWPCEAVNAKGRTFGKAEKEEKWTSRKERIVQQKVQIRKEQKESVAMEDEHNSFKLTFVILNVRVQFINYLPR